MDNKQIYKKTLTFSIRKLLVDLITLVVVLGLCVLGFVLLDDGKGAGILGIVIGLVVGIIIAAIIGRFVSYTFKASQIAMMTYGVVNNKLPEDVYKEGRKVVKEKFATVAALFAVTNAIKGIFNQIGRAITAVGNAIGGDSGSAVGSAISSIIQTIIAYMCDCCLGWVFFREDQSAVKSTLEGAVLFFKHGKALAKNLGRIFGIGLLTFVLIGGVFFGISYLVLSNIPGVFSQLAAEIAGMAASGEGNIPAFLTQETTLVLFISAVIGVCIWSFIHSCFIRPFVLVGVLRNYLEAGKNDIPKESQYAELAKLSPKFAKEYQKLGATRA